MLLIAVFFTQLSGISRALFNALHLELQAFFQKLFRNLLRIVVISGFYGLRIKERCFYFETAYSYAENAASTGTALKLCAVWITHFQIQAGDGRVVQNDLKQIL